MCITWSEDLGRKHRLRALRLILGAVLVMAVLGVPVPSSAQAASKMYRIAVLANENTPPWELFRQGLRDLGYVDGRNVTIDWRWSEGRIDRFPALALEVVALKPDIIVASGTPAGRAAKEATSVIPIVFFCASFPDKTGLVQSLSRPGGNVTGLSSVAQRHGVEQRRC